MPVAFLNHAARNAKRSSRCARTIATIVAPAVAAIAAAVHSIRFHSPAKASQSQKRTTHHESHQAIPLTASPFPAEEGAKTMLAR